MTPEAKAPVTEGEVVAGKYRIEGQLGSGGMGVVVAARHLALGERVALKFVTEARGADREAMRRMLREARATFRLRSEHAVRVLDVGELPSGPLYIVMELLEGRDLRAELDARGPLPEGEVVGYALEACEALEEAHALGIVHRDLKPHNMFLARSARGTIVLKVLDFGMSKLDPAQFDTDVGPLTRPETALGTPKYMAPEQWKSAAAVDARADVWALGVVMYELLTGKAPVAGLRGAERLARLLAGAIEDPRELRPDVSEPVARAIMRCLRADREVRWPSIAHLRTALHDAHPHLSLSAPRAEVTRTDVTVAVRPSVMEKRAAQAFSMEDEAPPATRPATPAAMRDEPPCPDDFDMATEVRAPQFTPASPVIDSGPATARPPRPPQKTLQSKVTATTPRSTAPPGRSSGPVPPAPLGLGALDPLDRTRPIPGAPVRPPLPALSPLPPQPPAAPARSSDRAPVTPVPTSPPAPRLAPQLVVLVAAGGVLSVAGLAGAVWLVARLLGP